MWAQIIKTFETGFTFYVKISFMACGQHCENRRHISLKTVRKNIKDTSSERVPTSLC